MDCDSGKDIRFYKTLFTGIPTTSLPNDVKETLDPCYEREEFRNIFPPQGNPQSLSLCTDKACGPLVPHTAGYNDPVGHFDICKVPEKGCPGWYLALMAPNEKGHNYAWLDPSRLYCHQQALKDCIEDLLLPFKGDVIDLVVGIDAMGFILGAAIAARLGKGFLAIRKSGNLCVKTETQNYVDYSGRQKVLELRTDAIKTGLRILLVDQWIETGGTMKAAIKLVENQGGTVAGVATICIEDSDGGRWVRENYKCSDCVPDYLRIHFNNHNLENICNFYDQQNN